MFKITSSFKVRNNAWLLDYEPSFKDVLTQQCQDSLKFVSQDGFSVDTVEYSQEYATDQNKIYCQVRIFIKVSNHSGMIYYYDIESDYDYKDNMYPVITDDFKEACLENLDVCLFQAVWLMYKDNGE